MEQFRIDACQKVIRHIKSDVNRIRNFSPLQKEIRKSEYCERLAKDIQENLVRLYTCDEIEYVVNTLGKHTWNDVLYYVEMFDRNKKSDDLEC